MIFLQTSRQGFWLVGLAAILWGTIGVATRGIYALDSTSSLFVNLGRLAIATPILVVACWRLLGWQMFDIRRRDLTLMILTGVMIALSQAAYFAAIRQVGVTIATLLALCTSPVIVAGISVLLKLERLTVKLLMALGCAVVGSILLVGVQTELPQNIQNGVLYSLLCALFYAGMMVGGRFLANGYHSLQITSVSFGAGAVMLLALNLAGGLVVIRNVEGWLLLAYLGIVPTALAYWLFLAGMRHVSATTASIVALVDPLTAALLAWLLFGETLSASGLIGVVFLVMSFGLASFNEPH